MSKTAENRPRFFGMNGFIWFFGVVTNRDDPEQLGRVQIRIFNVHTEDQNLIPNAHLPWAWPIQSITSAAQNEIGVSPTGIMEGSVVFGFFTDGADCQQPVILGTLAGAPGGVNDIMQLALGINTITKKETVGVEPSSPYGAKYPFNKVIQTEAGHVVEIDDTPGKERIHIYHRKGTYDEVDENGNRVTKTVGNEFEITVGDKAVFVQGSMNLFVKGNINIEAYNDVNLNVSGKLNASVAEAFRIRANGMFFESDGPVSIKANGSIAIDSGSDTYIEQGASVESGLEIPNPRDISVYVPSIEDRAAFENDDNDVDSTSQVTGSIVANRQASNPVRVPAQTTICGINITEGQNLDDIRLTNNYTVGSLSSFTEISRARVVAQMGLTEGEIVCNLKLLAANCLDKIKAKYPTMIVTHAFRLAAIGPNSKHKLGQAADMQFTDLNAMGPGNAQRTAYYERCLWIKDNVPYDALLMEYKNYGTAFPWIHIQFNKDNLRHMLQTYNNNAKVSSNSIQELLL